MVRLIFQHVP